MQRPFEKDDLATLIESLRMELIETGVEKGLTNQKTIQISKELDQLLAEYQALIYQNRN
jgi:hypothetical protein